MNKFVYVFDEKIKEEMLERGYKLLKSDEIGKVYIFNYDKSMVFEESKPFDFVLSDTLTF